MVIHVVLRLVELVVGQDVAVELGGGPSVARE